MGPGSPGARCPEASTFRRNDDIEKWQAQAAVWTKATEQVSLPNLRHLNQERKTQAEAYEFAELIEL
jgi:hypothetical protein